MHVLPADEPEAVPEPAGAGVQRRRAAERGRDHRLLRPSAKQLDAAGAARHLLAAQARVPGGLRQRHQRVS